jgi:GDP-4-dehydro-6-deoxy-D-mannose reductase
VDLEAIQVVEDPCRVRPSDVPRLIGDNTKARRALGWEPEIPWAQTLIDLLQYWLSRYRVRQVIQAG